MPGLENTLRGPAASARRPLPNPYPPLGTASSPSSFGHNGSNVTLGWTDPSRRLTVAYLTSTIRADNPQHITAVADSLSAHYDAT